MKIKIQNLCPDYITVAWCDMQTDDYEKNFVMDVEEADVQTVVTLESPQVLWEYLQAAFKCPLSMWYWIIADGRVILSGPCDSSVDPDIIRDYYEDAIDYGDFFSGENGYSCEEGED